MKKIWDSEFREFNKVIFKYFIFTFIIFFGSIIIMKYILQRNPNEVISTLDSLSSVKGSTGIGYKDFFKIFFNNSKICLLAILSGFIPFIFLPLITCIRNAYFVGLLFAGFEIKKANLFLIALVALLPHGIFEIPAVLYSFSIGTYLCTCSTISIIKETASKKYIHEIKKAFIYIIVPLLFIAALTEAFIVPYLVELFIL